MLNVDAFPSNYWQYIEMLTLSPALQLLKRLSQKWLQFGWSVKIGMQSSLTACKQACCITAQSMLANLRSVWAFLDIPRRPSMSIYFNISLLSAHTGAGYGMLQRLTIYWKLILSAPLTIAIKWALMPPLSIATIYSTFWAVLSCMPHVSHE